MGVIVDRPTIFGTVSVQVDRSATPVISEVAVGLRGYVQIRDVPYPPKQVSISRLGRQVGFINPTPYRKYGTDNNMFGLRYAFGLYDNPEDGQYSQRIGVDTQNSVDCDLSSFPEEVAHRALQKAFDNMKNQKVNLAQAFAERKATAATVSNTLERLFRAAHAAKKGDLKRMAEALGCNPNMGRRARKLANRLRNRRSTEPYDDAHNLWLSHRYGWMPLLQDVKGSAELLAENDLENPQRYACSVKGSESKSFRTLTTSDIMLFGHYPARARRASKKTYKAFVRLDLYLDHEPSQAAAGLGLTNPAALAWELLPWSFVADWFLPVGQFLGNLDVGTGWKFRAGSISKKREGRDTLLVMPPDPPIKYLSVSGNGTARAFDLERVVYPVEDGMPTMSFSAYVTPKNPFSVAHVFSAISLLRQATSG